MVNTSKASPQIAGILLICLAALAWPTANAQLSKPKTVGDKNTPTRELKKNTDAPPSAPQANAPLVPSALVQAAATKEKTQEKTQEEVDYIVALVNSEPLTRNDVLRKQKQMQTQGQAQEGGSPIPEVLFKRALEQLIDERVVLQVAKEQSIRISDVQLDQALMNVATQNQLANIEQLRAKYEAEGGNWSLYREDIRAQLARLQVRERQVDARIQVSDTQVDQAIQELSAKNKDAQDINLAQILIALPDNPSADEVASAQQKAMQTHKQAQSKDVDFFKLAERVSQADDRAKGGVMGLRSAQRYPPLFVQATQNLKPGEVSQVVRSAAGFHILKLLERHASLAVTVVQSRVRHLLLVPSDKLSEERAKARLNDYKNQIESGRASFSTLAREYSMDGSAAQGGDLGYSIPGLFVPEFERVINALPVGKLSQPFTSRFGVHLVEVTDRKEVAVSAQELRELVRAQLREKQAAEAYGLWIADNRARAFIEYKNVQP